MSDLLLFSWTAFTFALGVGFGASVYHRAVKDKEKIAIQSNAHIQTELLQVAVENSAAIADCLHKIANKYLSKKDMRSARSKPKETTEAA